MPSLSFCPSTSGWKTALNDRMEECSLAISVDGCAEHLVSTCNPLLLHSALAFRIERQSRENPNLPEKTVDLDSLSSKVFSSFGFSPDFSKSYSFSKRQKSIQMLKNVNIAFGSGQRYEAPYLTRYAWLSLLGRQLNGVDVFYYIITIYSGVQMQTV